MVVRRGARPGVALRARDLLVHAEQRIPRGRVVLWREPRWLPTGLVVTAGALAAIASCELPLMRVPMAIEATRMRDLHTEFRRAVTLRTFQWPVLAIEGEFGS